MSFSLKTLKLLHDAGVVGHALYEILASVQADFDDPSSRILTTPRVSRRRRRAGSTAWEETRKKIFERDGYACRYCDEKLLDFPTIDHVHPLSRGGSNDMDNLVTSCAACNGDKGDMTVDEWNKKKAFLPPYIPERKPYTLKMLRSPQLSIDAATVKEAEQRLAQTKLSSSRKKDKAIVEGAATALQKATVRA